MEKNPAPALAAAALLFLLTTTTDFASAASHNRQVFEPIFSQLGLRQFASAFPSFLDFHHSSVTWNGPLTVFAPPDESSPRSYNLEKIGQYVVPGLLSFSFLKTLPVSTKLGTSSPGHCLNITSVVLRNETGTTRVMINEAEITHPDMFNDGLFIVHGLNKPLHSSSLRRSCGFNSIISLVHTPWLKIGVNKAARKDVDLFMMTMLPDAILRLGMTGYGILAIAMMDLYPELAYLQNATVFAIDDESIFTENHRHPYECNVKYHILPNLYLETHHLEELPFGKVLPTLNNQYLVVTRKSDNASLTINTRRIKTLEVMKNLKIVVHALHSPFPHISFRTDHSILSSSFMYGDYIL